MNQIINIALPKGRLGEKVYDIFEMAGYPCPSIKEDSRKLIFENSEAGIRYFWVKPSDVAIYVERGAADIGVAGKDIPVSYTHLDVYKRQLPALWLLWTIFRPLPFCLPSFWLEFL